MAKFLSVLAASVGSGLVLGASIRLGENLGSKLKAGMPESAANGPQPIRPSPATDKRHNNSASPALLSRLDRLEAKMSRALSRFDEPAAANSVPVPEWESIVAGVVARMDRQQAEVDSIRQQVARATGTPDPVGDIAKRLRNDLHRELSRNLDERLAAIEARIHLRMDAAQGETLDAMVSAMENRMTPRIVRMEGEIAGQTAAVSELRECALESERSVQRLIGVLERIMSPPQGEPAAPRQGGPSGGGPERPLGENPSPAAATPLAEGREGGAEGAIARMPSSFAVLNPIS